MWRSQLISEICLGTLHAEYVGPTNALCALIPIRSMITTILNFLQLPNSNHLEVDYTAFKDD